MTIDKKIREEFFARKITMLVDEDKAKKKAEDLMERLKEIGFTQIELFPISAGYGEPALELYHNRDLIYGGRIKHFVEYAGWYRNAS